jgi:hypothetical protein
LAHFSIAGALAICAVYVGCSVESHTFVDDSFFDLDSGTGNVGNGGTGGGGGTTGGSGGGPGGSGGGTGDENCVNGMDDDSDGQIDCADSDCQPLYACVPAVPAGWTGPVAFYEGTNAAPLCNASGGFPTQKQSAHSGIVPGDATCPTCECNFTGTPVCKANLVFGSTADCQSGCCWGSAPGICTGSPLTATNGTCLGVGLCQNGTIKPTAIEITSASVSGTCTSAANGTADIPTPTWTNEVRACGDAVATGKGCGTDGACMPVPAAPFGSSACIYKTGDTSCPSPFSTKHLVHQNTQDTRSCTPCSCGALTGGDCTGGTVSVFPAAGCGSGAQTATIGACNDIGIDPSPTPAQPGQCEATPGVPNPADSRSVLYSGATPSGTPSCPPSGGQVSGAATAIDPITFCCL